MSNDSTLPGCLECAHLGHPCCREHASRPATLPPGVKIVRTQPVLPTAAADRKKFPLWTGVMLYFPDALIAVAEVSRIGNDQHNFGEELHWAREKSTDQMNTAARHMLDHSTGTLKDTDGAWHLAKSAWRILAELQLTIEKNRS